MSLNILEQSKRKKPLISVCVVTYNQEAYIRAAVMSVVSQCMPTLFDLEILIGDDGSTDSTAEILQDISIQYPEMVFVIRHQPNVGAAENYRALIRRARGGFVAHLDGDDCWLPGKLQAQLRFLEQHPECIAVYTGAMVVDTEMNLLGSFTNAQPMIFGLERLLSEGNFICHSTLFYRASGIQKILSLPLPCVDFEVHLALAIMHKLGFVNQQLAIYRSMVAGSFTRERRSEVDTLYFSALKRHLPIENKSICAQALAHYAVNIAAAYPARILERDFWKGIEEVKNKMNIPAGSIWADSTGVFCMLLKRKFSRIAARRLNSREGFIIFYPTR